MKKPKILLFSMAALFCLSQAQQASAAELESFDEVQETIAVEAISEVPENVEESEISETDNTEVYEGSEVISTETSMEESTEIEIENTEASTESEIESTEMPVESEIEDEIEVPEEIVEETVSEADNQKSTMDTSGYANKEVADFVVRMYEKFLSRTPDKAGLDFWYEKLVSKELEGANIVDGFVDSAEFKNLDLSTEDYLKVLYNGIFDREADASGIKTWGDLYNTGVSHRYIPSFFVASTEFKELCASYNITAGKIKLYESRDVNPEVTKFVSHFYTDCLDRKGDAEGLNNWTKFLLNKTFDGTDVADGFIFSKEYLNTNPTNEEFIRTLYRTLLSREADQGGLNTWMEYMDNGVSEHFISAHFILSPEFTQLCKDYGILRGNPVLTENRDKDYDTTAYVTHVFREALGHDPKVEDLNNWTGFILDHRFTAKELAEAFFLGGEYQSLNKTEAEFIQDLYETLLKREVKADELELQLKALETAGGDRKAILDIIAGSTEHVSIVLPIGIAPIENGWTSTFEDKYYISNKMVKTGWLKLDSKRYYLNPSNSGALQKEGWAYIDGYKLYFDKNGVLDQDVEDLIGPQDEYMIKVYKWGNYLTIFAKDGDNGFIIPVKAFITSCGNATPTGYYRTPWKDRWCTMLGGSQAQWVTQITGDFLFHSVPYAVRNNTSLYVDNMYNHLGSTRSMGCIRLEAGNAKWIYDNCKLGTLVHIDPNVNSGPFDKPNFTPVPSWHTWDPTDPTARHLCQQRGCH